MPMHTTVEEYKTIRDEMINLFHRIFLVLAAEIAAYAAILFRALEPRDDDFATAVLLDLITLMLAAGLVLTIYLYEHIYKLGAYIVVYLEDDTGPCWHRRIRDLTSQPSQVETSWPLRLKVTEPAVVGALYCLMALGLLVLGRGQLLPRSPNLYWVQVALTGVAVLVVIMLFRIYRGRGTEWIRRWVKYKNLENGANKDQFLTRRRQVLGLE